MHDVQLSFTFSGATIALVESSPSIQGLVQVCTYPAKVSGPTGAMEGSKILGVKIMSEDLAENTLLETRRNLSSCFEASFPGFTCPPFQTLYQGPTNHQRRGIPERQNIWFEGSFGLLVDFRLLELDLFQVDIL